MEELKFTGNCLKGSRALLSFDPTFETEPHLQVMKEMFVQIFGTPYHFPRSQPFIDHVFTFTFLDNRIWFRNFQIMEEGGSLVEIGPRFILNPIRIFEGSFNGVTAWSNPHFVTPGKVTKIHLNCNSQSNYIIHWSQKFKFFFLIPCSIELSSRRQSQGNTRIGFSKRLNMTKPSPKFHTSWILQMTSSRYSQRRTNPLASLL